MTPQTGADTRDLSIDHIGGQGDGVAEGGEFVPLTLPGERVRVRMDGKRGEVVEILDASPDRIAPVSPQYGDCGGCSLQHWAAKPYLDWKREQVRLILGREGLECEIAPTFATPPASRRPSSPPPRSSPRPPPAASTDNQTPGSRPR